MIDPLTLFLIGAGALAFREMNKKDYGILTAARDERYRVVMSNCQDPEVLKQEAKLFEDHGLKAQGAMLRRRAEWRSRPDDVKKTHEDIFLKAMHSTNIPAVLEVAAAFEGWTATNKATALREHARKVQEEMLQAAAVALQPEKPVEQPSPEQEPTVKEETSPHNGANGTVIPQNTPNDSTTSEG